MVREVAGMCIFGSGFELRSVNLLESALCEAAWISIIRSGLGVHCVRQLAFLLQEVTWICSVVSSFEPHCVNMLGSQLCELAWISIL